MSRPPDARDGLADQAQNEANLAPESAKTADRDPKAAWRYGVGLSTHVGKVRLENQDAYAHHEALGQSPEALVVVCDGMGGHFGGSVASRSTADAVISAFSAAETSLCLKDRLAKALGFANQVVRAKGRERPELRQMGTTCTALCVEPGRAVIAHVGDSRAYLLRAQEFKVLTRDHTYVNELVAEGLLEPEEAKNHPRRHVITRCIGMADHVKIDVHEVVPELGDTYLLCSDGLFQLVEDAEIARMVSRHAPQAAAERLVDLANERGGDDNITVAILSIRDEHTESQVPEDTSLEDNLPGLLSDPQSSGRSGMPMSLLCAVLAAELMVVFGLIIWTR